MKETRVYPHFSSARNPFVIYEQFSESPEGQAMQHRVRFASFQGEISNDAWVRFLGADVNNCEHMRLSIGLTRWFIAVHNSEVPKKDQFDKHEQELLCLAAGIHDQAEFFVGDIPNPQKTAPNEEEEMRILKIMIDDRYGSDPSRHTILQEAVDTVLTHKKTKLGGAFSAIEYIGYMRTAVNAWKKQEITNDQMAKDNLQNLAIVVKQGDLEKLMQFWDTYPAVQRFLALNQDCIDKIP